MNSPGKEAAERVIRNLKDAVNRGQSTIISPAETAEVVVIMEVALEFMRRADALDDYARRISAAIESANERNRETVSALILLRAERDKADADDRRSIVHSLVLIASMWAMFWILGRVLP